AAIAHYGYTRDAFLAMRITDIRPQADVPRLLESVAESKAEPQGRGHWRHQLRDGRIIDVEVTAHGLTFAGREAVLVVATDISARLRAEEALRASEERFRALSEHAT